MLGESKRTSGILDGSLCITLDNIFQEHTLIWRLSDSCKMARATIGGSDAWG